MKKSKYLLMFSRIKMQFTVEANEVVCKRNLAAVLSGNAGSLVPYFTLAAYPTKAAALAAIPTFAKIGGLVYDKKAKKWADIHESYRCPKCGHVMKLTDRQTRDKVVRCVECTAVVSDRRGEP